MLVLLVPEPCKGRSAATATHSHGKDYLSRQRLLMEEDLAAGADQAHLAVLQPRGSMVGYIRLCVSLSLCFSLFAPLALHFCPDMCLSLLQSSFAYF